MAAHCKIAPIYIIFDKKIINNSKMHQVIFKIIIINISFYKYLKVKYLIKIRFKLDLMQI